MQSMEKKRHNFTFQSTEDNQNESFNQYVEFEEKTRFYLRRSGNLKNHSNSHPCEGLPCYEDHLTEIAFAIALSFSIVGTFGNLLSMVVILSSRLRTITNSILILQLNVVNFLYCFLVLPIQAIELHIQGNLLGNTLCRYKAGLRFWLAGADMLLISAIAVYRLLQVVYHGLFLVLSHQNLFLLSCTACYIVPAVYVSLPFIGVFGDYVFEKEIVQCTLSYTLGSHKIMFMIVGYTVPASIVVGCYLHIAIFVHQQGKTLEKVHKQRRQRMLRNKRRLFMIVALTVFTFLLGMTPFTVVNVLDPDMTSPVAHLVTSLMSWSSYMLNPMVYSLADGKFQKATVQLFYRARWSEAFPAIQM